MLITVIVLIVVLTSGDSKGGDPIVPDKPKKPDDPVDPVDPDSDCLDNEIITADGGCKECPAFERG